MKKSLTFIFILVLGAAFLIGSFQTGWAQEDEFTLEEITVTAQKREENVQDVPVAISVANREQIERQHISTITDLARITPALEFTNPGQGPGGAGQIRGIGTVTFSPTAVGSVAVVIDDVPAGEIPNPNIFDIERVEVLRGPQGMLFGQAASAGVINMVTVAPDFTEVSGNIHIEYADKDTLESRFGQEQVRGALNVPFSDNSAMRISAMANTYIGLQKNLYNNKDTEDENYGVRANFLFSPNDDLDINFIADYNKQDLLGPNVFTLIDAVPGSTTAEAAANGGFTAEEGNQNAYYSKTGLGKESENYGAVAKIDYTISDYTLTSISAYREQKGINDEVVFPYPAPFHLIIENFGNNTDADQFSQEFRVISPAEQTFEYVAGLFYSTFNKQNYGPGATVKLWGPSIGVPVPIYIPVSVGGGSDFETENDSMAAYGQLTYNVTENAALFAGLRLTRQTVEIRQTDHETGAKGGLSEEDDNLSFRFGGQYRFNPQLMAYGSITRGYKPMQLAQGSPDESGTIIDIPAIIKPEEPLSFEAGMKSSLLDNRVALDFNVFHNTVENYQGEVCSTTDTGAWSCVPQNEKEVVAKGFEIDLIGRPLPGLSLMSGLIYVSAEYPSGRLDEDGSDISGKQLINVPEWKFVLSGDYTHKLTNAVVGYIAIDGTYRTEFQTGQPVLNPKTMVDGYWDLGCQLGVRSSNDTWGVVLWGRNLLDENAQIFAVTESDGETSAIYGNRSFRQVGISLDYRF